MNGPQCLTTGAAMQTALGNMVRLDRAPDASSIDLQDMVEHLAKLNRWTGATATPVSVAQHSVWVADAMDYEERAFGEIGCAYALLHDAHEAYMGDLTTPVVEALIARAGAAHPLGGMAARAAVDGMKRDLDAAIHAHAKLPFPPPPEVAARVKSYDLRALESERRQHLDRSGRPRPRWGWDAAPPKKLRIVLKTLPWPEAADLFRRAYDHYVPRARAALAREATR